MDDKCLTFLSNTRGGAPCLALYLLCLARISFLALSSLYAIQLKANKYQKDITKKLYQLLQLEVQAGEKASSQSDGGGILNQKGDKYFFYFRLHPFHQSFTTMTRLSISHFRFKKDICFVIFHHS